jgi:endonuclease III
VAELVVLLMPSLRVLLQLTLTQWVRAALELEPEQMARLVGRVDLVTSKSPNIISTEQSVQRRMLLELLQSRTVELA